MPSQPRVKVCGLTRLPDAELSVSLGAWALGMVFAAESPRRCSLAEAQLICARLRRKVDEPHEPPMIHNVRGMGFILRAPA